MTDKLVVLTNCGSAEEADRIARTLIDAGLSACVNILPGVRSVYRWSGAVEDASEWTLLIKTTRGLFDRVAAEIRRTHSYELPEVIALPVVAGLEPYLAWIDAETSAER